jgi:hypothetical protein
MMLVHEFDVRSKVQKKYRVPSFLCACGLLGFALFGTPLLYSQTTVSVQGLEQSSGSTWDSGNLTVAVNGHSETFPYGQFSTTASLASGIAARFSQDCGSSIAAKASGSSILFMSKSSSSDAALQINASVQWNTPTFTVSSFKILLPDSNPTSLPNGPQTPSLDVECTPNPIPSGAAAVCSARLPHAATGTVTFALDGNIWTSATVDSTGVAVSTDVPSITSGGTHSIVASYSGDSNFIAVDTPVSISELSGGSLPSANIYSYSITTRDGTSSGYDPVGNVVAYTDSVNGTWGVNSNSTGTPLAYDNLNRLVLATQTLPGSDPQYACWSYDSFGNMQQEFVSPQAFSSQPGQMCVQAPGAVVAMTEMTYGDSTNRITSGGWKNRLGTFSPPSSPTYDGAGNMTNDLQNAYLYDADGHVCAVQQPTAYGIAGPLIGYLYDAEGHRVAKGSLTSFSCDLSANGFQATNVYIIGPDGQEMTEVDGAGNWVHTNVSAGGGMIATYKNDGLGVHFQLSDWVGTRRVQTDYLGQVEDQCQSQPFGDGLICSGPDVDVSKHHSPAKKETQNQDWITSQLGTLHRQRAVGHRPIRQAYTWLILRILSS